MPLFTASAPERRSRSPSNQLKTLVESARLGVPVPADEAGALHAALEEARRLRGAQREAAFALLLRGAHLVPQHLVEDLGRIARALALVGGQRERFLRPLEAFASTTRQPETWLFELCTHLLAEFPVPRFVLSVFTRPEAHPNLQGFFARLGQGESVRALFPMVPLTKRAAHVFRAARPRLGVFEALRFAQGTALAGDEGFGHRLAATAVGKRTFPLEVESFLQRSLPWLAAQRKVPRDQLDEVLTWALPRAEADARFSLGGRTFENALALARRERALGAVSRAAFEPSGILGGRFEVGGVVWQVQELCTPLALFEEGQRMEHCVFDYVEEVRGHECAIFSLLRCEGPTVRAALTLEVSLPERALVQALGKHNRPPFDEELAALSRWCEESGLTLET